MMLLAPSQQKLTPQFSPSDLRKAAWALRKLTPRRREVLSGIIAGRTSKEIAEMLNISPRTVEIHRSRSLIAFGARNVPELVGLIFAVELRVAQRDEYT